MKSLGSVKCVWAFACLGLALVALAVGCGDKGSGPRSVPSSGGSGYRPAQGVVYAPAPAVYAPPSPPTPKVNKAALERESAPVNPSCRTCYGAGWIPCPLMCGNGQLPNRAHNPFAAGSNGPAYFTCPGCQGSSFGAGKARCPVCKGSGKGL